MSLGANQHVFWNIDSLLGALIIIRCRRSIAAVLSAVNRASKSHYGQQSNHIVISTPFGLYFLVVWQVWHLVQALPRGDEHDRRRAPLSFDEDRLTCTLELGGNVHYSSFGWFAEANAHVAAVCPGRRLEQAQIRHTRSAEQIQFTRPSTNVPDTLGLPPSVHHYTNRPRQAAIWS